MIRKIFSALISFSLLSITGGIILVENVRIAGGDTNTYNDDDPVAYWNFNEGSGLVLYDQSGNNNHGVIYGAQWTSGISGNALYFDGITDYVKVNDSDTLDITNGITIEAWIKPSLVSTSYIISKPSTLSGGSVYTLDIYPGKTRAILQKEGGGSASYGASGTSSIIADIWQHLAVTWDGTTVKIYYNGCLEGTNSFSGQIPKSTASLFIGNYVNTYFKGYMDEIRIYDHALNEDQLHIHFLPTMVFIDDDYTAVVPGWNYTHFNNIQKGVDAVSMNGTVYVYNGTYYENIVLYKSLTLQGEHNGATMINASDYGDVITVASSNCTISGFTLINSGNSDGGHINCGIYCDNYSPWITNNILAGNSIGIGCWDSASPIIQNNSITNNTNNGIYVYASFPHIENNSIMSNGDTGITLRATAAPTIIGNTIIHNPKGINCNYITGALTNIKNNNISHNQQGIKGDGSFNIILNFNSIFNNSEYGITFSDSSSNNSIANNLFFNNSDISISLSGSCTNNTIANNTIRQSHVGIHLSYSRYNALTYNTIQANQLGIRLFYSSNNNTVKGNTLVSNDIGLYLFSNSKGNHILENTITTSTTRGINVQSLSNNNSIFHNNFIDNVPQARDDSTNVWDHDYPTGGNYWSDFDESSEGAFDNDSDGIIDTPYFIPGGNNSDRYPLMIPHNLIINQPPACTLSATPTSGTFPLTVTFTMTASDPDGTIDTWKLDINNDGTAEYSNSGTPPSTQQHTYQTPGSYTAKLLVTDNQSATASDTSTISVSQAPPQNQPPEASFIFSPAIPIVDETIFFDASSSIDPDGSLVNYEWDFNNDGIYEKTGITTTHMWSSAGEHHVSLRVKDNNGSTDIHTKTLTVVLTHNLQPTCSLTVNPTSGTAPLIVTFTLSASDSDGSIASWKLDTNNDGTAEYSNSGTPPSTQQHTYQTPGSYTARFAVTDNDGAPDSDTKTITVNQPPPENQSPIANFTYSLDGYNVTFTDISEDPDGDIIAWYWDFGDDNSSTVTNPTHSYQEEGSYTVTVTVTDNNEDTDTYSKIITVTVEDDGDGIPGFEFIPFMFSLLGLLLLARKKRRCGYK